MFSQRGSHIRYYDLFRRILKQDMTPRYNLCGFWCLLTYKANVQTEFKIFPKNNKTIIKFGSRRI